MSAPAEAEHRALLAAARAEAAALGARASRISTVRLVVALGAVAALAGAVWGSAPGAAGAAAGALVVAFVALVVHHARLFAALGRAEARVRFHDAALRRAAGEPVSPLVRPATPEASSATPHAEHPYADDLDVVGPRSLFERLDVTRTVEGERALAAALLAPPAFDVPSLVARQDAVRALAALPAARAELFAAYGDAPAKIDVAPLRRWLDGNARPAAALRGARLAAAAAAAALAGAALVGGALGGRAGLAVPVAWALGLVLSSRRPPGSLEIVADRDADLRAHARALAALAALPPTSTGASATLGRLQGAAARAQADVARLGRIVSVVEARRNDVFRLFVAPLLLWDVQAALWLEAFHAGAKGTLGAGLDALAEAELVASLATLAAEDAGACFPELVPAPRLVGTSVGHPLLGAATRVGNDVALAGRGAALVVTGSNMAGKSTLLRALGLAVVLGRAGGPVVAARLALGPLRPVTSLRVRDEVGAASRFYAELRKLKRAVDDARATEGGAEGTLFLLDEVMSGTNARERLVGARALLAELVRRGALGAIATHDLELARADVAEGADPAAEGAAAEVGASGVRNVHFEEQVDGETMTFDYRLRPGVVRSSNALRLMRSLGLPVD